MPCAFLLIVLSVGDFLYAIVSYFVQIGILICYDVQVTSAVGGRLGGEGQEVDVGLREQISDLLVEVKGELQVQSRLTTGIEFEPGSLVLAEVENYVLSIVAELYNRTAVRSEGPLVLNSYISAAVVYTVVQRGIQLEGIGSVLSLVLGWNRFSAHQPGREPWWCRLPWS